jgi:hypothetical protein
MLATTKSKLRRILAQQITVEGIIYTVCKPNKAPKPLTAKVKGSERHCFHHSPAGTGSVI